MTRLTRQQRTQLATDLLSKNYTTKELIEKYHIDRTNIWRLKHMLIKNGHLYATPESLLIKEVEEQEPGYMQQGSDGGQTPYQSAKGDPQRPTQQQHNQGCEQR